MGPLHRELLLSHPLEQMTPGTITDVDTLMAQFLTLKELGYVI